MIDVVVVGSGPNGLAAAIRCAEAGREVLVIEGSDVIGGGTQTAELTLPGFHHDVCSAIHPLAAVSPFFAAAGLEAFGLDLVQPEISLVHPLDGGRAGVFHRSLAETVAGLGVDGKAWDRHVGWVARRWDNLASGILGPLVRWPDHPLSMAAFGARGTIPATIFGQQFRTEEACGMFAGAAAHAFLPLNRPFTTAMALGLLGPGHVAGWPAPRGGSAAITRAMAAKLESLGGKIETGRWVRSLDELPSEATVLFDVTPRQLLQICGDALPAGYRKRMSRFRYGPGVFKIDFALSEPVPWTNEHACRAGGLHLGGTMAEVAAAEAAVAKGRHPERPFVLVAQPSLFDDTRAPAGQHTLWTYCHVPSRSTLDMTDAIVGQLERFAPGFRDVVLAQHSGDSTWYEEHNPNYVGGDIAGGSHGGLQLLLRPRPGLGSPYATGNPRVFLCSASTPPGGGVHGMAGLHAADQALKTFPALTVRLSPVGSAPVAIRVVLAEDNALLREGVARLLERADDLDLVGVATDLPELEALLEAERPDLVVTDIRMPPTGTDEGIRVAAKLRTDRPEVGVVVLSQYAEPAYALALLEGGSEGRAYLLKERVSEVDDLLAAIREVAAGGSVIDSKVVEALVSTTRPHTSELDRLTPREREILGEMAQGKSNAAIAATLVLSTRAVEKHTNSIFSKLGLTEEVDVNRRVKAVLLYLAEGGG